MEDYRRTMSVLVIPQGCLWDDEYPGATVREQVNHGKWSLNKRLKTRYCIQIILLYLLCHFTPNSVLDLFSDLQEVPDERSNWKGALQHHLVSG